MSPRTATTARQQSEGWQLEGNSAEAYERYLVPTVTARWADHLVSLAAPHAGGRILDVGCGTGIVARTVTSLLGNRGAVTGVDLNADMLTVARAASATIQPGITYERADAAALPFADSSSDIVLCQYAMQFFADPAAALREMRRVLSPDGRLALMVGRSIEHNRVYGLLADAMERHVSRDAGLMMRSPFPDWSAETIRKLVIGAGFRDVKVEIHIMDLRYSSAAELLWQEASYSPLAVTFGSLDQATRAALEADVTNALAPYTDDNGVAFSIESHTVIARR